MKHRPIKWARAALPALLLVAAGAQARALVPLYSEAELKSACAAALKRGRTDTARMEAVPLAKVTVENTLNAWNLLQIGLDEIGGPAGLYANVSTDEKVRAAADDCTLKLTAFGTELNQNDKLYQRFKAVRPLTAPQKQLQKDLLHSFEDTGVALPTASRARVKAILDNLEALRQEFDKNVREDRTKVTFTADEMKGLPQSYLDAARRDDKGNFVLGFDYPEYEPFMHFADSEPARKRYYIAFTNRGGEGNLKLMNEIMRLRLEMARLFDLPSYAHYVQRRRMAEDPVRVNAFLAEVQKTVREVEQAEVDALRDYKATSLGKKPAQVTMNRWDVRYYQEKMRKERFDIDQEALRAYFPTPAAIDYTLHISSLLYGLGFKRVDVPVWHPDVTYYDVLDTKTGKAISGFYLDLYPRDGKYKHAAVTVPRTPSGVAKRAPVAVMMANFNRQGLDHRELETLLHEFGHVLNNVLSVVDYASHTWGQWDFVEAPSQMFEEWGRRPEALAKFRDVCATCPLLDADLAKRLDEARRFGAGVRYARQLLYASFDMALTSDKPGDALAVWQKMEGEGPLGHAPGTIFPASFSHIANSGYGAGYYGYMWSEVLALDMLSAFGDNLMNPKIGRRFRDVILAQGGQVPAKDLVHRFLGREPNSQAFFAEITGQR